MTVGVSPFIGAGALSSADSLAIVHLKRDQQIPAILREFDDQDEGYAEGKVLNTQFGSFPHSTLIGLPWGSQVRASNVDTGSRGRRKQPNKKRKREQSEAQDSEQTKKQAVAASSGFIHLLAPTPENWTASLPHRTQVVYTPDYSYILHRIRARPGTKLIEAGAGSGSFTHASARAVFSGWPSENVKSNRRLGKVWSFEFHEQRHEKLQKELQDHGLKGLVEITHRDVCKDGFLVGENADESPNASAIFLDLPAPWVALTHLTRSRQSVSNASTPSNEQSTDFVSPLDPKSTVHICTFSPCIEQVQRTVSVMRQLGWVDINMVEIAHRRIEVRRDRLGIEGGPQRGVQPIPSSVDEAVERLREVEGKFNAFHKQDQSDPMDTEQENERKEQGGYQNPNSHKAIIESLVDRKVYKEGKLVHRTEPEIKSHTSYLVFAIMPQEWTEEDEAKAKANWPIKAQKEPLDLEGKNTKRFKKAGRTGNLKKEPKNSGPTVALEIPAVAMTADNETEAV